MEQKTAEHICARLSIATSATILYCIHRTTDLGLSWERVLLYHRLTRELSIGLGSCSTEAYVELGIAEKLQISENRAQMDGEDVFWFVDGVFEEPEDDEDGPEADEILIVGLSVWQSHQVVQLLFPSRHLRCNRLPAGLLPLTTPHNDTNDSQGQTLASPEARKMRKGAETNSAPHPCHSAS